MNDDAWEDYTQALRRVGIGDALHFSDDVAEPVLTQERMDVFEAVVGADDGGVALTTLSERFDEDERWVRNCVDILASVQLVWVEDGVVSCPHENILRRPLVLDGEFVG